MNNITKSLIFILFHFDFIFCIFPKCEDKTIYAICQLTETYDKSIPGNNQSAGPLGVDLTINFIGIDEFNTAQKTVTLDIGVSFTWNDTRLSLSSLYTNM